MLDIRVEGGVARFMLDRPAIHNAFDGELVRRLREAFEDAGRRDDLRVVVLGGRGKSFSAGGDLNWMRRTIDFSLEENLSDAREMSAMFRTIATCPKPVIARVHGAALGGGVGLVAASDMAIAVESAVFGFTEVRLGIVPGVISPWVVARTGLGRAREYMLTGERFPASTAQSIGLIHSVSPDESALDLEIERRIQAFLAAAPGAVARTKSLLFQVGGASLDSAVEQAARALAEARVGVEGQAGMAAFLERRKPPWLKE